jgi:hypothetical protein
MGHFQDSPSLNRHIAENGNKTCILSFSCGKDAIAAWLELKRYFDNIVPVYMNLVPGLEFVEIHALLRKVL